MRRLQCSTEWYWISSASMFAWGKICFHKKYNISFKWAICSELTRLAAEHGVLSFIPLCPHVPVHPGQLQVHSHKPTVQFALMTKIKLGENGTKIYIFFYDCGSFWIWPSAYLVVKYQNSKRNINLIILQRIPGPPRLLPSDLQMRTDTHLTVIHWCPFRETVCWSACCHNKAQQTGGLNNIHPGGWK